MDKIIPALLYILAAKPPNIKDLGEAICIRLGLYFFKKKYVLKIYFKSL